MATVATYFRLAVQLAQSTLARRLLGEHAAAILVRSPYGLLAIDPADRGVGRQLLRNGQYADQEINRLLSRLSVRGEALVVGAHVGAIALALARRAARVVAVEPNPRSYELLETSVRVNGVENCELLNIAAADKAGTIDMLVSTANSGGSKRIPRIARAIYSYDKPQRISVPAARLDDLLPGREFELVVMDIEGSEYFALNGMQSILRKCGALAVEFLPHHLRDVSGISVEQFLQPIAGHFNTLMIPSTGVIADRSQFLPTLTRMYNREHGDDGIIFSKRQYSVPG